MIHTVALILKHVFFEFWGLFGVFLLGGALLTVLAKWLNNSFEQFVAPRLGFYLFGIIGIPIHEFSHAVFCWVFRHQINHIKWFDPKGTGESHGSVSHSYNPWNIYHRMGHFFIGLGPTILGPLALATAFYFLVPSARNVIMATPSVPHLDLYAMQVLRAIFNQQTLTTPGFYLFAYLAIAVCSQIELSPADLKQVAIGIVPLTLVLIIADSISWAVNGTWHTQTIAMGATIMRGMSVFFTFATILSIVNLVFFSLILGALNLLFGRPMINPFSRQ